EGSSKYDNLICKTLISSGFPSVYKLTPKEERIGTLKKYILGERNPHKTNKTVLLLGETGTGKSTLINALVNYAIGVTWEDNVYFKIVDDDSKDQAVNQTDDVIVYQIFGFEDKTLPYSLTIIDTPGYGNTEGDEHDAIIPQRLFDLFCSEDGIQEINAVGLVIRSTNCRLTDRLFYIFDSVTSLFGKDLENNVVFLMTYSNGRRPNDALNALKEAKIKHATDEKNQPVYFLFDNCWNENRNEDVKSLKSADEISRHGLRGLTEFLNRTLPQNLEKTLEVINERISLTACINSLQEKVKLLELKLTEIQQIKEALKQHEEDMEKNESFKVTVDEPYKELEPIQGWPFFRSATYCPVCEENCHYPGCIFAIFPSWCEVMVNGRCTVCTNKCEAS
uniref:AAA+ ATPase domain-containing protein n=1 Tax=Tetraodon nigroviridis TaxID=99883 RepID=H3CCE6_TETNG